MLHQYLKPINEKVLPVVDSVGNLAKDGGALFFSKLLNVAQKLVAPFHTLADLVAGPAVWFFLYPLLGRVRGVLAGGLAAVARTPGGLLFAKGKRRRRRRKECD